MGGAAASFLFPVGSPAPSRAAGSRRRPSVARQDRGGARGGAGTSLRRRVFQIENQKK